MPLVLVKETGVGLANANAYANVADSDAYHEGHLWASTWTSALTATKEAALVLATRLIDACIQFHGSKTTSSQALQWPRFGVPDPDYIAPAYYSASVIPAPLQLACCEMAREVIALDRTQPHEGEGIIQIALVGSLNITFDKKDIRKILTELARLLLSKLGTPIDLSAGSGKLVRS